MDRQSLARDLAATYQGGRYADPWEAVENYRAYQRYIASHPNAGSHKVGRATDQPRSRVRQWMDEGSKPDPVRAIEIAEANDWLDWEWDSDTTRALNCLVAWIFAGGSITRDTYAPYFAVDDDTAACARTLITTAMPTTQPRRNDRADDRADELTVTDHQPILGRYLAVLGAPIGTKNPDADLSLPAYLDTAPPHAKLDFARTYVWHRGTPRQDLENWPVQIREKRSLSYVRELQSLFNELVVDALTGAGETYQLSADAADQFDRPPSLCSETT